MYLSIIEHRTIFLIRGVIELLSLFDVIDRDRVTLLIGKYITIFHFSDRKFADGDERKVHRYERS